MDWNREEEGAIEQGDETGKKRVHQQKKFYQEANCKGTWVAQSVEHLTLGIGSGHDLMVCGIEPCAKLCTESKACLGFSLSFSLFLPHLGEPSLSKQTNK